MKNIETRLTTSLAPEMDPVIWGTRVLYHDGDNVLMLHDSRPPAMVGTPRVSGSSEYPYPIRICYLGKTYIVSGGSYPKGGSASSHALVHMWKKDGSGNWVWNRCESTTWASPGYVARVRFPSTGSWRLRAYIPPGEGDPAQPYAAAWSKLYSYVTVSDVYVGRPNAPERMHDDTNYTVAGYLKPQHAPSDGTGQVLVYKWKKRSNGSWERRGYAKTSLTSTSSGSRYRARMSFSSPGRWRVRAYHPECRYHGAKWSTQYDYVTVVK